MTGITLNGDEKAAHSGAHTLALLASPLSFQILRSLGEGPKQQMQLRRACGMPAQTTLRAQLKKLDALGTIAKHRRDSFPGVLEYELTDSGRELLGVAQVLERWLGRSPEGPLELGGSAAKAAIRALVEGWSTCMLRALAAKPLTLTELDEMIASINYPSLERRLSAMRLSGQIEPHDSSGRGRPYGIGQWGREAVAPILVASRWERTRLPDSTPPIAKIDAEAAFLLVMPLLRLDADASGTCRLATDIPNGKQHELAGVLVSAEEGRIASCTTRLEGYPDAWVSGSPGAWLAAAIDGEAGGLELGGDCQLARTLVEGLHDTLFAKLANLRGNR